MVDPSISPSQPAINDDGEDPSSTPSNNPIEIIDEESSLSTATSLTSLITSNTPHTLRTGVDTTAPEIPNEEQDVINNRVVPQEGRRNRSMSVPNSVFLSPDGTPQMRSISANRNRSNPRTRTPMRHASPLLVTGRLFTDGTVSNERGEGGGRLREGGRSESIIEETGTETNEAQNEPTTRPGRLLYAHARPSAVQGSRTTQQPRPQRQLSTKQLPSHRKLRRWNNDRFINTHTGTNSAVHPVMVKEGEEYYQEYWMPNYPCEYRSEFAKLVTDESKKGSILRERFLKGEVGTSKMTEPAFIMKQFQNIPDADLGHQLYRKLSPRIRSILTRCRDRSSILEPEANGRRTSMTIQAITAFETYITSCVFKPKKSVDPSAGFPPLLSDELYAVFNEIFCAPPNIVIKKSKRKVSHGVAVVPSIHFYFHDESNDAETKRNGSFNRILLYAVCNFHGLVASSHTLDGRNNGKSSVKNEKLRKGVKVVTVQSDVILGIDLKLLDFVNCSPL